MSYLNPRPGEHVDEARRHFVAEAVARAAALLAASVHAEAGESNV